MRPDYGAHYGINQVNTLTYATRTAQGPRGAKVTRSWFQDQVEDSGQWGGKAEVERKGMGCSLLYCIVVKVVRLWRSCMETGINVEEDGGDGAVARNDCRF